MNKSTPYILITLGLIIMIGGLTAIFNISGKAVEEIKDNGGLGIVIGKNIENFKQDLETGKKLAGPKIKITSCKLAREHETKIEEDPIAYYTGQRWENYVKFCILHPECYCTEVKIIKK